MAELTKRLVCRPPARGCHDSNRQPLLQPCYANTLKGHIIMYGQNGSMWRPYAKPISSLMLHGRLVGSLRASNLTCGQCPVTSDIIAHRTTRLTAVICVYSGCLDKQSHPSLPISIVTIHGTLHRDSHAYNHIISVI